MESAHAEAACLLIEAGADRTRENLDGETPENLGGVGGQEQRRARAHVIDRCGPPAANSATGAVETRVYS
ncbi:hypothetical protein BC835DRAFT_902951 [Cytidiella melzeri]|nr:hypothetical protein BC835DRAFT_902951 [Cytidiella melzeri]